MLNKSKTFTSFSTSDLEAAREFYATKLGFEILADIPGAIQFKSGGDTSFMVYEKGDEHQPANYTTMYFEVDDIEATIKDLNERGITMEQYPEMGTDEKGIASQGDDVKMAWFKDPAGNILSVIMV